LVLGPVRYVLFAVVGLVVASAVFFMLNLLVSASYEVGTGFIERWILRATCHQYELQGTVHDTAGKPVPFAVVEVSYLDQQLSTRSGGDGTFSIKAAEALCDKAPPANVAVLVVADQFRPKRQSLAFDAEEAVITLDPREFRP
jgi:hypothetical protein